MKLTSTALALAFGVVSLTVAGCNGGSMGGPAVGSEAWLGSRDTDKDKDGTYSREEVNDSFSAADSDGDGKLSSSERSR